MVTSVTKGGTQKLPTNLRLSKHTDMTIHWKALEEHLLMEPLSFSIHLSLKELSLFKKLTKAKVLL
jgi:hypothetical protein